MALHFHAGCHTNTCHQSCVIKRLTAASCAQAGPNELEAAVRSCGAVDLDGRWHLIEPGYHDMLFEVMVLTAIQNSWELPRVPLADMVLELCNDNFDAR